MHPKSFTHFILSDDDVGPPVDSVGGDGGGSARTGDGVCLQPLDTVLQAVDAVGGIGFNNRARLARQ